VPVEPIPETVEALRELTRLGDESIARTLLRISRDAERIVPQIVGVSLSLVDDGLTFTMTATAGPVAELDGMQYLAGGPCDDTLRSGQPHIYREGNADDEERWQLFARATAAAGVAATLSLPILRDDAVVAGINLYASEAGAFEGRHEELAEACGAWADGAVTNADLGFNTLAEAAEAPDRLRTKHLFDQAVGVLMAYFELSAEAAEERLRSAAHRAGIPDTHMARAIHGLFTKASHEDLEDDLD
jgi:GAF domain-containing protein